MVSYWVDYGFFFLEGSVRWRFPIAVSEIFTAFVAVERALANAVHTVPIVLHAHRHVDAALPARVSSLVGHAWTDGRSTRSDVSAS